MPRVTVISPMHDLMLTYSVTGISLQKTLGVSYYIFRRLLAGVKSPSEHQLSHLRMAFPAAIISQDSWDVFVPYDRDIEVSPNPTTLRAGYVTTPLSGVQISTKASLKPPPSDKATQRHQRSVSETAVARHPAFTEDHYAETTTPAKTVSLSLRERHLLCLNQISASLGITKAETLRRLLNFVFEDILGAPSSQITSVGPTPALDHALQEFRSGRLWPGEGAPNEITDATIRAATASKSTELPPEGIPKGYEKLPPVGEDPTSAARKAALQAKLDNLELGMDTADSEEPEPAVDSSKAWGAAVLTPAGVSINPETGEAMLDQDED